MRSEEHEKKVSLINKTHLVYHLITLFFLMASHKLCQTNKLCIICAITLALPSFFFGGGGEVLFVETYQHKISRGTESENSFVKIAIRTVKSVEEYSLDREV